MKTIRVALMLVFTAGLALGTETSAMGQSLPTTKVLTFDAAQTIAQAAMAKCRADGYKVTVVVVDALNMPMVMIRDDGAVPATTEFAKMKATTTMYYSKATGPAQPLPPGTPTPPAPIAGTHNAPGGVPVKSGDYLIGAVGVAGGPGGDKDAVCANAGVAKIAELLK
jgi:uncharacterized protein GlcG (DUF336 family)